MTMRNLKEIINRARSYSETVNSKFNSLFYRKNLGVDRISTKESQMLKISPYSSAIPSKFQIAMHQDLIKYKLFINSTTFILI